MKTYQLKQGRPAPLGAATRRFYKGYNIIREFPGQWEIEIWGDELRPTTHLFGSLLQAKAWIDVISEGEE